MRRTGNPIRRGGAPEKPGFCEERKKAASSFFYGVNGYLSKNERKLKKEVEICCREVYNKTVVACAGLFAARFRADRTEQDRKERNKNMSELHIIDHPMIQHKLTIMRDKRTGPKDFRELLDEITVLMGYEVTRDFPLDDVEIETPMTRMKAKKIAGKKVAIVPILRAGLGMVDGLLSLLPVAKVGHIGLYRDPKTHLPVVYYCKLPFDIEKRTIIVCDPMLATGGSSCDAIRLLKEKGCCDIRLMCLVAAPEGVRKVQAEHPDVNIYVAALDERLNENAYILPGLGDAGDRLFGTK